MRLSAMGDVAMTVPVLSALVKEHPEVKITFVSRPVFKPLFQHIPNVSFFSFESTGRHKGLIGLFRFFLDLNRLNIDAFADLHSVLRSKIVRSLFALRGTKVAFTDKARAAKKMLTRLENKTLNPLPTVFERHIAVFDALGFPINWSQAVSQPKPDADRKVLKLIGDKSKVFIGIAPFAQYESKVYPLDLMRKAILELSYNTNYSLLLFGSKQEVKSLMELVDEVENAQVVAGQLSISQELQLISNLDLMLSMDSANGHLAAMFGVKTITLWGATHPCLGFAPFKQPLENSLTVDRAKFPYIPTSVYGNKRVDGYEEAMRTITTESIVNKVNDILKKATDEM